MKKYLLPIVIGIFYVWSIIYHETAVYPYPASADLGDFIYLRQPDSITCGPTSTLMLLLHYQKDVTLEDVETRTKTKWFRYKGRDVGMTAPDYIVSAMGKLGVPASMRHGKIDMLKYYVSGGRPCIVLLRSSISTWHYVLVIGYNERRIIIADPAWGLRTEMMTEDFLGSWSFNTNMRGEPLVGLCPLCHGTGRWLGWNVGPFGICEICNGTGKQPDYLGSVLSNADVSPYTLIVPKYPVKYK